MNNPLTTATLALLFMGANLHASHVFSDAEMAIIESARYSGPQGDALRVNFSQGAIRTSTLGMLACYADVIGVGLVSNV